MSQAKVKNGASKPVNGKRAKPVIVERPDMIVGRDRAFQETGLTAKQDAFAREYLVDSHVTRAAERAGYAKRSAPSTGAMLLTQPNVKAKIQEYRAALMSKYEVSQGDVIRYLVEDRLLARELGQMGPAVRADELLGKRFGMWIDRSVDISISVTDKELVERLSNGDARSAKAVRQLLGRESFDDDPNDPQDVD